MIKERNYRESSKEVVHGKKERVNQDGKEFYVGIGRKCFGMRCVLGLG